MDKHNFNPTRYLRTTCLAKWLTLFSLFLVSTAMANSFSHRYDETAEIVVHDEIFDNNPFTLQDRGYKSFTYFTCESSDATKNGACPSNSDSSNSGRTQNIKLDFRNASSGVRTVELAAVRWVSRTGKDPHGNSMGLIDTAMNNPTAAGVTRDDQVQPRGISLKIKFADVRALDDLPPGIWNALLRIQARRGESSDIPFEILTIPIELKITDDKNVQVLFPKHRDLRPELDLQFEKKGVGNSAAGSEISGKGRIDICMYDGFDLQSSSFLFQVQDKRNVGGFNAYLRLNNSEDHRIEYRVNLNWAPLYMRQIPINIETEINGKMPAALAKVSVKGKDVRCSPGELIIETESFSPLTRPAGQYSGALGITFGVKATVP